MSKIKEHLIDIYGEDWGAKLEDIAIQRKAVKHDRKQ